MKKDIPVAPVDLQARAVERAKRGEWPGIRVILRDAIESIATGRPIHEGRGRYLAEALENAGTPEQEVFAEAARHFRSQEPLPSEIASPVQSLLEHVISEMGEASIRQRRYRAEKPTDDCSALLSPISPPVQRFLKLDAKVAAAFGLRKEKDCGGRPRQGPPTDQLFDVYDELRGYGATKTQAQEILAHRFKVTSRTIQRKLERRPLATVEQWSGEPIVRLHEPGQPHPENPLQDRPPAFEPYLKARLAMAVSLLQNEGIFLDQACEQVADDFGWNFDRGDERVDFGTEIVQLAFRECEANQSGWASVPLAICSREIGRRLRNWPSPKGVAEVRGLAATSGESPSIIDSVSRDMYADIPTAQAVQAVAEETGLEFDLVMELCRFRHELKSDRPED